MNGRDDGEETLGYGSGADWTGDDDFLPCLSDQKASQVHRPRHQRHQQNRLGESHDVRKSSPSSFLSLSRV